MKFKDYRQKVMKEERRLNIIQFTDMCLNGADELVDIYDIVVPNSFKESKTKKWKIYKAFNFFVENEHFDKPIEVLIESNEFGNPNKLILVDGYSRYIAAKWLHMRVIPVKYIETIDTTTGKYNK